MNFRTLCAVSLLLSSPLFARDWLVESQNTMRNAKQVFATILRNKDTSLIDYRKATDLVASVLACEAYSYIQLQETTIDTPLAPIAGVQQTANVILLPVIRSGLTLLPTFLRYFETARVGFVGLARDEETAIAHWYYEKLPKITGDEYIIILEPMLATGGTGLEVLETLKKHGAALDKIIFVSVVCAPEGLEAIEAEFPQVRVITVGVDSHLNDTKFIVPGLGDFGDRYFGTE